MENRIEIPFKVLPKHIAFILDGNGRWAKSKGLIRTMGHAKGVKTLKNITKYVKELGIPFMSVYAFSVENWSRPKDEVEYLMDKAYNEFKHYEENLPKLDFNIRVIGEKDNLPPKVKEVVTKLNNSLFLENRFTLFICFNYSSKLEIVNALNEMKKRKLVVNLENFEKCLYTYPAPPIDLLVRTSGEMRLSNYMLYQASYAELYFPKVYWPAFTKKELYKALEEFEKRNRRFGNI